MDSAQILLTPVVDALVVDAIKRGLGIGYRKIRGEDPVRQALEVALSRAIKQYATSDGRLEASKPLLRRHGFLAEPTVAAEVGKMLSRDERPDATLIGERWKAAMPAMPQVRDFTAEAETLLAMFSAEVERVEPLRSIKELQTLGAIHEDAGRIADGADEAAEALSLLAGEVAEARQGLADVVDLIDRRLEGITRALRPGVRIYLYDQTGLIAEKTREFVGRDFIFNQIQEVIKTRDRAYCHVLAYPGVGKTALMAQLVKDHKYVHHFNVRTDGVVSPKAFLGNVCAQLVGRYDINADMLPPHATEDGAHLGTLLRQAVDSQKGRKVIIVVDALDESDASAMLPGTNPLYLPKDVPEGVFFLVTSKPDARGQPPRISVECPQITILINHRGAANMEDIRRYLRGKPGRPFISEYMRSHGLTGDEFVEHLAERSDGNFMYLHHVLPDIESGALRDRDLRALPLGLYQYYLDHLERMRSDNENSWFQYELPVIAALSRLPGPSTVNQIAALSKIDEVARVQAALRRWGAFVVPTIVLENGARRIAYRFYHASFQEFLRNETAEAFPEIKDQIERGEEEMITALLEIFGDDD